MNQRFLHKWIIAVIIFIAVNSCRPPRPPEPTSQQSSNNNIENSTTYSTAEEQSSKIYRDLEIPFMQDMTSRQRFLREAYTVCYNNDRRCADWVAWVISRERTNGDIERKVHCDENGNAIGIADCVPDWIRGDYIFDNEVDKPQEFSDWTPVPEGLSHGHLCPAADCKLNKTIMNQSFLLSNICVQAKNLNSGSWNKLEDKCRKLVQKYNYNLYIVAGPVFKDGKVSATMGANKIAIPDAFFKVVLCMDGTPKAIGFFYANNNESHNMQDAVRTVDQIEELTGIDFFPQLPNGIEEEVESHANLNEWQ